MAAKEEREGMRDVMGPLGREGGEMCWVHGEREEM